MTAVSQAARYRIGELADRVGVTARTIRYYEELGLLGTTSSREKGKRRLYGDADVTRLQELIRLRDLLGLSLEDLIALTETEEARSALRDQWADSTDDEQRAAIVEAAIPLIERQLQLVKARQQTLSGFADELVGKLRTLKRQQKQFGGV